MDAELSDELRNVKITIYPSSSCDSVSLETVKNWNSQICAGELAGGKDTCFGDSGGSLYAKGLVNGKEKFVSIGITSYGDDCASVGKPGLEKFIFAYLKFFIFLNIFK